MFVPPIMLLPYIMFSTWMGLFGDAASRPIGGGKPVPDPLARSGAGSVSHAALDYWATPLGRPTESRQRPRCRAARRHDFRGTVGGRTVPGCCLA